MSTLAVTTVTTGNTTTDQTIRTGNTTAGDMIIYSNGFGIALGGNSSTNTALLSPNGHIVFANGTANTLTLTSAGDMTIGGSMVMATSFMRNRIINGNMYIAQRATTATVTAGTAVPTASAGYPCVDRFFVYSTGANVTAAQVAGTGNNKNVLQVTGAASVTAVGIGQRIEALNSYDLANTTCTLSVNISNSLLTTVTWTASYATTSPNTFGTIGAPTKTQIATGTFTVTSTLTRYTASMSVPAAAVNGIEILFTVGAQTSGTWQIGDVQFETGAVATPFERLQYGTQFALCQRYYEKSYNDGIYPGANIDTAYNSNAVYIVTNNNNVASEYTGSMEFKASKFTAPSVVYYDLVGTVNRLSEVTPNINGKTINNGAIPASVALNRFIYDFNILASTTARCQFAWTASSEIA